MPSIVLIGSDTALLEGIAQTLAAAGFRVRLADSFHDAASLPSDDPPLVAIVDRTTALASLRGAVLPALSLAPGGSLLLYHPTDDDDAAPLPASLQRVTLADLELPLERQRLVALIQSVAARARTIGRDVSPGGEIRR